MYVYSWFIVLRESSLTVRLAVSEIKPVQSRTDRRTDRQTDRIVNYSNSRCACARGLIKKLANLKVTEGLIHLVGLQGIQLCDCPRDSR